MKHICIGILAHVDAGKTTLSEAMLYLSGSINKLGRVDHQNAFLDTNNLERERGITIFSKQAVLKLPKREVTLLDTPGHVDFNYEVSRSLAACDGAILVVESGETKFRLAQDVKAKLERTGIPILGAVLNKVETKKNKGYYSKYYGKRYGKSGYGEYYSHEAKSTKKSDKK